MRAKGTLADLPPGKSGRKKSPLFGGLEIQFFLRRVGGDRCIMLRYSI
jgi:hypothetical protein